MKVNSLKPGPSCSGEAGKRFVSGCQGSKLARRHGYGVAGAVFAGEKISGHNLLESTGKLRIAPGILWFAGYLY